MTLDIVLFGLSITSAWGNGHAVTYRALAKALNERGHRVTFLERDVPWYRDHRDLPQADYCTIELYRDLKDVPGRFGRQVARANLVILGSYVPEGIALADWITRSAQGVTAFYDIDTPVTLAALQSGTAAYIAAAQIPRFDLYLSFTGGPALALIEQRYGSPRARPLYCAADLSARAIGHTESGDQRVLGYLGTYSADRQAGLDELLLQPARQRPGQRFVVAGAQYPENIEWPSNVARIDHIPPADHPAFYRGQRFTLNLTRAEMRAVGHSPSVRLFEAAACGAPIISDHWPGLDVFFAPDREILVAHDTRDVLAIIDGMSEERRREIAAAARKRLLREHTPHHRALALESYVREASQPIPIATKAFA